MKHQQTAVKHALLNMDTSTILLTLLQISNILNFVHTKDKYADCKSTYTLGYGYKHIYHISESEAQHDDSSFTFHFWVRAFSDAHILLSPTSSPGTQDPVYEIVIGAGKNTFSTIRRQILTQIKQRAITIDYLSDTEYRGFWIQVSKFGQIQVGRAEDNVPFMFWFDTEPLPIRYFSFCSWGSVVARWYYSCPNDTQSEEVDVPTKMTTIEQLREDLLLHYDPFSRPILNENDTTYIFIYLTCQNIKVDEKKSAISIVGEVTMHWEDQKLQWKPQDYDNISLLTVLHHEVWQPELILYNAVGHGTDILTDTPLLVSSLGLVVWKSQGSMQARCSLDLSQWPNDEHTCELQLGFWAQHEVLNLDLIGKGVMLKDEQHLGSEWDILSLEADQTRLTTPWINTTTELKDNKALSIRLSLRRKNNACKVILQVPLLVYGTMTLLSFWISPMDPNKMLLSCLNLVIMAMFIVALGAILPAPATQTPQIVLTYSHGMVAVAISLLISVLVTGLTRYNHIHPLPSMLRHLITMKTFKIMLCLPSGIKKESSNYQHLQESGFKSESFDLDNKSAISHWEIQQQWVLFATAADRLAFIIYIIYLATVMINHG